jgi:ABC-type multidrug transport system ATPase subunit
LWKCPPTSSDDWIIDSAIAYVAQNPWTENGTIRDNILFGLPLDRLRYQEVLFASGLERDLDILADGDQTDIGANGINLSGGQRLRVSFARALYSRAGILIMDDIFSALDTDTCHHVYKYGLTGDLAQNRTRILATHNVGLCLPRTDHLVVLAGGSVRCAGSVEELRKMESSADFLADDDGRDDDDSQRSQTQRRSSRELNDDKQTVTKFSPEEQRATGSVPLKLHKKFMTADNTPWIWVLGIVAALLYTVLFFGRVSSISLCCQ